MAITALPTPPRRDSPDTFADDGDLFLGALPAFATEANALAVAVNAAASTATGQAEAALAAVNCPAWVSGTTYSVGQCVYSPITHYSYRRKVAGSGTTDPSADATNWQVLNSGISASGTETLTNKTIAYASNTLTGVQPTLVSGTNIKTINGASILSSGDIVIDTIPFGAF